MKKAVFLLFLALFSGACSMPENTSEEASEVIGNVIMSRRSIRRYQASPIGRDTLDIILNSGINAPNGQNRQAYEIRVVENREFLDAVSTALNSGNPGRDAFAGAPCVVFLANDTSYDMSQVDCGLLGENLILSAWSMGIGSCCMAGPIRQMKESEACAPYLEKLGFSEGYNLLYCITLGYPDEAPDAKPRKKDVIRFVE